MLRSCNSSCLKHSSKAGTAMVHITIQAASLRLHV